MKSLLMNKWLSVIRCSKGGVMIFAAFALLIMVIASGLAIDISRAETAKVELYGCLDTAGLAALAKIGEKPASFTMKDWIVDNVRSYFLADCRTNYMQTSSVTFTFSSNADGSNPNGGVANNININLSPDNGVITLDARLYEQTEFMPVVGIHTMQISGHSVVRRATGGLELAIVLDNTFSMGWAVDGGSVTASHPNKITALKCALAGDAGLGGGTECEKGNLVTMGLLDVLFNSVGSNLFVGLISFADMVNVGATHAPGANFISNPNIHNSDCVDARSGPSILTPSLRLDIADDPPSSAYFKSINKSDANVCPKAFQPMTTDKTTLVNQVQMMTPNGNTMLQLGFAWGWRMLSPNWTGLWGSTPTYTPPGTSTTELLPLPYNTKGMNKVVIFMTDGLNAPAGNPTKENAYDDSLSSEPTTVAELDALTLQTCTAMKNNGITIYTIGFGPTTGPNAVAVSLLKSCASSGTQPHFFIAATNADLQAAFQEIGGQLTNLVVSQ